MENTELIVVNNHDAELISMWLHGRSDETQRAYKRDVISLLNFTGKAIQETTLADLQHFADSLTGKVTSRARTLKSVKSLFTFSHKLGYVPMNVGAALLLPKVKEELAQRIMEESDAIRLIENEKDARNHAILRLMYHCGLRVSEVVSLKWQDVTARSEGAQISIFGKGGKTRQVLMSASMWKELQQLDGRFLGQERYIFQSRKGKAGTKPLDTSMVNRIVEDAAMRVGIAIYHDEQGKKHSHVSPHWLRHAHASHSLDRGASINLVRDTLGHASIATTGKYSHARPNESSSKLLPL